MSETKTCFVIAPIGEPDSKIRKRSDQILEHVIKPALEEFGYTPIRADQISEPGIITSQVIQHIVDDPLVIADLTGRNPNVFYELAIRHALKKPLIQIIETGELIPFDVAGTRTIHVDHHDLDSVAEAKTEIIKQINSLEEGVEFHTPISVALDLQILSRSEDPGAQSTAEILQALSTLQQTVWGLQERIERSEGSREFLWHDIRTTLLGEKKELEAKKAHFIAQMGSNVKDVAVAAAEQLARYYWLYDGSLRGENLAGANLQGANLMDANLQSATLTGANLQRAMLVRAKLQGADLSRAKLQADLGAANLQGANLQGAKLQGAALDKANLIMAGLTEANLRGAILKRASLGAANLQGANLQGADLEGADLRGANLVGANLQAAKFDEDTILPDRTRWTPGTDVAYFTDPDHPDFWRPPFLQPEE